MSHLDRLPRHFSTYFQLRSNQAFSTARVFESSGLFLRPSGHFFSDVIFHIAPLGPRPVAARGVLVGGRVAFRFRLLFR